MIKELTNREKQVLEYILKGHTNKEISEELCISYDTAKAHVSAILYKMHVEDRLGIFTKLFNKDIQKFIDKLSK